MSTHSQPWDDYQNLQMPPSTQELSRTSRFEQNMQFEPAPLSPDLPRATLHDVSSYAPSSAPARQGPSNPTQWDALVKYYPEMFARDIRPMNASVPPVREQPQVQPRYQVPSQSYPSQPRSYPEPRPASMHARAPPVTFAGLHGTGGYPHPDTRAPSSCMPANNFGRAVSYGQPGELPGTPFQAQAMPPPAVQAAPTARGGVAPQGPLVGSQTMPVGANSAKSTPPNLRDGSERAQVHYREMQ
ncbi:unnamed protein product [Peniophora sp. CBMAI 1063]|nr:unnamed protein product [Peniophora sp. CBMAI 1063]